MKVALYIVGNCTCLGLIRLLGNIMAISINIH